MLSRIDLDYVKTHQHSIQTFVTNERLLKESIKMVNPKPVHRESIFERIAASVNRHTRMLFRKTVNVGK